MKTGRKSFVVITTLAVLMLVAGAIGKAAQAASNNWLERLWGDEIVVTFITPPPNMEKAVKARLISTDDAGIVLRFGKEEILFCYANIISIEPAPQQ